MNTNTNAETADNGAPSAPAFTVIDGAPASAGVRRVSLGKLGKATKSNGSKYPTLPDPSGVIAAAVDQYVAEFATFEALEGSLKCRKAEFNDWTRPFYYQTCAGRPEIPSSILALSEGNQILLTFQDRYSSVDPDWDALGALLGDKLAESIAETFDVKIDGAKIPADNAQAFIEDLSALADKHGAAAAVTAKVKVKPVAGFHVLRHRILTPEQNLALDRIIAPCVMSVKTKGVKR